MGDTESSIDTQKLMRQALAECIAVFIFVFSGCLCAASDPKEIFAIAMAVHPQLIPPSSRSLSPHAISATFAVFLPDVGIDFELWMAGHP